VVLTIPLHHGVARSLTEAKAVHTLLTLRIRVIYAPHFTLPDFTTPILIQIFVTLISDFRRDVDEIYALLGYYTASCGNCLPMFRDNVSVRVRVVRCPETSVNNYHTTPRNIAEERRSQISVYLILPGYYIFLSLRSKHYSGTCFQRPSVCFPFTARHQG
jgi:hypothetical protein